jgi:hypothetical protein
MGDPLSNQLTRLDEIARSLAETKSLKDIKAIRDKAEAARHYAQAAALGLKVQNKAAELKLRAERRAGELLAEVVSRGGNRKSNCHDDGLKITDLGIDYNQSSRWQREAAVPEAVFERYVAEANASGRDITAQGLLRIERWIARRAGGETVSENAMDYVSEKDRSAIDVEEAYAEAPIEMLSELENHRALLLEILAPICDRDDAALKQHERRMVARLLADSGELIARLMQSIPKS